MRQKSVLEHCTFILGLIAVGGGLAGGCDADSESPPAAAPPASPTVEKLRVSFPEQAEHVLAAHGELARTARGFVSAANPIAADLPQKGEDAVRLRLEDGWEVAVHEHGLTGEAVAAERAVTYRRAGGTSYWTAVAGGMEEWVHLEAGAAAKGGVAASWDVEGARLEQRGQAVGLFDTEGVARLWVTAPAAYKAGGEKIGVHLSVRGSTIEVSVDPTADEVLIDPAWVASAPMSQGRYHHRAVALGSGKVLVLGGSASSYLSSVEAYDYVTNTWATKASMSTARVDATATLLSDGRVLVTGGSASYPSALATTELYDPATDTWTAGASMATARTNHRAVTLASGSILVMGGENGSARHATAELYDPATDTWSSAASMTDARVDFAATLLADGRPIVMGGYGLIGNNTAEKGVEIYDPSTNTWSSAASMHRNRRRFTAERLASGKILAASGDFNDYPGISELYDVSTNTWGFTDIQGGPSTSSANGARIWNSTTVLPDGRVLLVGDDYYPSPGQSELYDPLSNSWSSDVQTTWRSAATTTLLPNGKVLVAGGAYGTNTTALYTAAAKNGTSCTSNSQCSTGICSQGVCCNTCTGYHPYSCDSCTVANGSPADGVCTSIPAGTGTCSLAVGKDCNADSQCASGFCVDNVCCNTACGGNNHSDCTACSLYYGASAQGTCTTLTYGPTCGSPNGAACTYGFYCQSGNCVDGVCCNTACGGGSTSDCQACSVAAGGPTDGTCSSMTSCNAANGASCSANGQCTSGFCVDGVCCNSACGGNSTTDCQACSTAAGASANGTCTTLTTGSTCGSANGTACSSGSSCQSGYCVDGYCCNTSCGGNNGSDCQACSTATGASANGTCTTLTTGSTCGSTNGQFCSSGTTCQSGNCVDGVCCNTACGGGSTTDCLVCSSGTGAPINGQCYTLTTGSCGGSANGTSCSSGSTCSSGYCVDGVCCNAACGGNNTSDCQACSTAAGASANGTCTTLTTGSCGSANGTSCSSGSTCSSGYCVDGVCCNAACGGNNTSDCQACSTAAGASANGTCTTLTGGSCGSTPTCITIQRGTYGTAVEAHVNNSSAGTNYGANQTLSIGSTASGNIRYGLMRFDLSAIPSTATITTATLTLSVFSGGGATVNAHRITSSWTESAVTWTSFASAFNSTVELAMSGSTTYSGSLASLVQSWVNGTYANYGIVLERDLTASTIFHASEWTTAANRPKLYVCYQ